MSNPLSAFALPAQAALGAAETPQGENGEMTLLAAGVILLLIWIARRIVHPKRLLLRGTPGRHNTVEPLHVVILLLVWYGSMGCVMHLVPWLARQTGQGDLAATPTMDMQTRLLASMVGQVCWLAASLVLATLTFRLGLRRGLGLSMRHWLYDGGRVVVATLAVLPVCVGLNRLSIWVLQPYGLVHQHPFLTALHSLGPFWSVLIAISAVVLAPLAEEVFFRGVLQSMLRRYTSRPWVAVVGTSLAFAAVHFSTPQNLPALFALSIVLGYNYERTGRLTPVIGIHLLFNAINLAQA